MNEKRMMGKGNLLVCLAVLLAGALMLCLSFAPKASATEESTGEEANHWHTYTMQVGETLDVGTRSDNTTVLVSSAGSYWLEGSSSKVRVVVTSPGVKLYLKDGLSIKPGALACEGKLTAAITVEDFNGTVEIISCEGATAQLNGYLFAPAIRKDGITTKLVFSTESEDNPGTIIAHAQSDSHCPGIGNYWFHMTNNYTGNIVINSGIIEAKGGCEAAGIGCSDDAWCSSITINGGNVTATGGSNAAGIGAGGNSSFGNITINGGTIAANGGNGGAGIGGSYRSDSFTPLPCLSNATTSITINGGDILATGNDGASGIGGKYRFYIDKITINGGDITAISSGSGTKACGCGIGSGNGGSVGKILITGGKVAATSSCNKGCGIGTGYAFKTDTMVQITGGQVSTSGGAEGYAIGGGSGDKGTLKVKIEGGTIKTTCTGEKAAVGSDLENGFDFIITGGNINLANQEKWPTDTSGSELFPSNITLEGIAEGTAAKLTGLTCKGEDYPYGFNDVYTTDGTTAADEITQLSKIHIWIPWNSIITEANAGGTKLCGYIENTPETGGTLDGTLTEGTRVTLAAASEGGVGGTALYGYYQKAPTSFTAATAPSGYYIDGYYVSPDIYAEGNRKVLEADGTPVANVPEVTDSEGRWIESERAITLYAITKEDMYTVVLDANAPEDASTSVEGTMDALSAKINLGIVLTNMYGNSKAYKIPGYYFTGWNTKPDGTGTSYANGANFNPSDKKAGDTYTLYAQWKPLEYCIIFDGNGATGGKMDPQTVSFDATVQLNDNAFTYTDNQFAGWKRTLSVGSASYGDEEQVKNLVSAKVLQAAWEDACSASLADLRLEVILQKYAESKPSVSLQALWKTVALFSVKVTIDDEPQEGAEIWLFNGLQWYEFEDPEFCGKTTDADGVLLYEGDQIDDGTYKVYVNGFATGREVTFAQTSSPEMQFLCYYSYSVGSDGKFATAGVEDPAPVSPFEFYPCVALSGTKLTISVKNPSTGYVFDSWVSEGADPDYASGSSQTSNPATIVMKGTTKMKATSRPVQYAVSFDANDGEGPAAEQLACVYDQEFSLPACGYGRTGYTFAGWNTKADGSGTAYADEQEGLKNLTAEDGATVTLYAQWKPVGYTVEFELGVAGKTMESLACTYDRQAVLPYCTVSHANYTFLSWNSAPDGSGTAYENGATVLNLAAEEDAVVTLYAQWSRDSYSIVFMANDGTEFRRTTKAFSGEATTMPECPVERDGYTFKGWNTKADGSGRSYAAGDEFTNLAATGESVTLYAMWEKDPSPEAGGVPSTGDADRALPYAVAALLSAAVLCGLLARARARRS